MNSRNILLIMILILTRLFVFVPLLSQDISDPEAEYARIRSVPFEGKLDSAAADARRLVNSYPNYGDARILLGRILAWKKDYATAISVIDTLLRTDPANADALSARNDILQWSKVTPKLSTGIRAGYLFDTFREPYNRFWQVFDAGAEHNFNWGLAAAQLNIGNAIIGKPAPGRATEWQLEAEAYPILSRKNYAYIDYAFSPGIYFPRHRAALEVWQSLPAGWAVSAGMNYYYFNRNAFIGMASVEKYTGKYWFSLKTYIYLKSDGPIASYYFTARRYIHELDYLQLTLGAGTAPDEPFDVRTDLVRLNAYSVRIAYNVYLTPKLRMRIGTGYSDEEWFENMWRNRFEGNINFIYAIKMK